MPLPPTYPVPALTVVPWPDPVIDELGHPVRSAYVERFWLGLLGPTSTLLLRRLAAGLEDEPDGFRLDLALTAAELGLGHLSGRHSPFFRSIERCCRFAAADLVDEGTLRVRRRLPPLTHFQLSRLPGALQEAHRAWEAPGPAAPPVEEQRERARGLALSLLELGEDADSAERQLHRWRLHPAMAHDAVAWATQRHVVTRRAPRDDRPPEAA